MRADAVSVSDNQTSRPAASACCETAAPVFGILSGMRGLAIGLISLCVLATVPIISSGTPAVLGSQYADAYTEFAPLYILHRAYAEYLFNGTSVEIPTNLADACGRFSYELALFHLDYSSVHAEVATAGGLAYLVRLRVEATSFCDAYEETIGAIAALEEVDYELLCEASDEGLFAEIKRVNDLMETTLDEILIDLGEGSERWAFAVTFSLKTLLNQVEVGRINANLREILYADPEGTAPPFVVPEEVAAAMERLVGLSGIDLSEAEAEEAIESAKAIYEYFIGES